MQIKTADDRQPDIVGLERLLDRPDLPSATRSRIEAEIRQIRSGARGEHDAAYVIELYFGRSPNWATIHDLRIEVDGLTAQIDHLIVNRLTEIWVCESKSFAEGVSVDEHGEWIQWWRGKATGIPSPIEQNHRHIHLLERVFDDGLVARPRALGILPRKPDLRSLILVSNNARIGRPKRPVKSLEEVIKAEQLKTRLFDVFDASPITKVGRVIGKGALQTFATELASLHRPASRDWATLFGLVAVESPLVEPEPIESATAPPRRGSGHRCASCGASVSFAVVKFCWNNKARFADAIYCMDCQRQF